MKKKFIKAFQAVEKWQNITQSFFGIHKKYWSPFGHRCFSFIFRKRQHYWATEVLTEVLFLKILYLVLGCLWNIVDTGNVIYSSICCKENSWKLRRSFVVSLWKPWEGLCSSLSSFEDITAVSRIAEKSMNGSIGNHNTNRVDFAKTWAWINDNDSSGKSRLQNAFAIANANVISDYFPWVLSNI